MQNNKGRIVPSVANAIDWELFVTLQLQSEYWSSFGTESCFAKKLRKILENCFIYDQKKKELLYMEFRSVKDQKSKDSAYKVAPTKAPYKTV